MSFLPRSSAAWVAGGLLFLGLVGCGDKLGSLSGSVTLDGQPLADGQIAIEPKDGQGTPAGGMIKDGKYSILGDVPPGEYLVRINASKVTGKRPAYGNDTNGPMIEISEPIIPEQFNTKSTLTVTIAAGTNTKNFEVTGFPAQ